MNNNELFNVISVKRDVDYNSEEEVKVKEQAILELGALLSETKQAEGTVNILLILF